MPNETQLQKLAIDATVALTHALADLRRPLETLAACLEALVPGPQELPLTAEHIELIRRVAEPRRAIDCLEKNGLMRPRRS